MCIILSVFSVDQLEDDTGELDKENVETMSYCSQDTEDRPRSVKFDMEPQKKSHKSSSSGDGRRSRPQSG